MLKWFSDRMPVARRIRKEEQGFTLIELLIVIIIIGVLAAIAIPAFLAQRERAANASVTSDLRNAATAAQSYSVTQNGGYTGLNQTTLTSNGASLSSGNSWGTISGNASSFSVTVSNANGSQTYNSANSPQMGAFTDTP